jgi:hypothetical protein
MREHESVTGERAWNDALAREEKCICKLATK